MRIGTIAVFAGAIILAACTGYDRAAERVEDTREAAAERVDSAIVDKVCRMSLGRLLELTSGDQSLADAIQARCLGR